jgi:hypothetical protein
LRFIEFFFLLNCYNFFLLIIIQSTINFDLFKYISLLKKIVFYYNNLFLNKIYVVFFYLIQKKI